jgi:beta-phosphoglucomutase
VAVVSSREKQIAGALKNDAFSVNCVRTSAENTLNGAVNSMTKAVLFDLDGVLVSTDEYHFHSWVKIASEEGFDFFDHAFNDQFRGVGRLECVEILTKASGRGYSQEAKQAIADRKNKYFAESLSAVTPKELLPGALAMLQELKKRGIGIAVASNSRNAQPIIKQTNIGHFLDAIVDGYQIEKSKPDPEGFLLAAKKLDVAPSACLVVEDAVTGIEAARRAGMKALGIGTPERLPNAAVVVPDLSAITVDRLLSL